MILTCPECSTRYVVDPKKLLPSGRVVRCAKCSHSWQEPAPADDIPVVEEPPTAPETPGNAPHSGGHTAKPSPQTSSDDNDLAQQIDSGHRAEENTAQDSTDNFDFPIQRNRPKRPRPPRTSHANLPMVQSRSPDGNRWGWVSLIVFIGCIITGLLLFPEEVSKSWPPASKLYQSIGLTSDTPSASNADGHIRMPVQKQTIPTTPSKPLDELLKIHGLTLSMIDERGTPTLTISGKIANIGDETVTLPPVKVEVTDAQRVTIREWTITPALKYLAIEGETTFQTSLPNPPQTATDVRVTFEKN
ncbi:MAG: hypothetical protein CMF31_04440 [Kordiimonas sp.]|nr:hypothetical protein [Kordiimonas sp.]